MKYVITGGAGFIGSHIAEDLLLKGHEVVIVDNLLSGKRENPALLSPREHVTFVAGSILDLPALKKTFPGADGIFHEAAIVSVPRSVTDPAESHEVNLSGTFNVLLAARDSGVKKLLFASSAAVYGDNPVLPKRGVHDTRSSLPLCDIESCRRILLFSVFPVVRGTLHLVALLQRVLVPGRIQRPRIPA